MASYYFGFVEQGPTAIAVGAGGVVWAFLSLVYHFSFLSPPLLETARYRLKYCLKWPLNQKLPTNHVLLRFVNVPLMRNIDAYTVIFIGKI